MDAFVRVDGEWHVVGFAVALPESMHVTLACGEYCPHVEALAAGQVVQVVRELASVNPDSEFCVACWCAALARGLEKQGSAMDAASTPDAKKAPR